MAHKRHSSRSRRSDKLRLKKRMRLRGESLEPRVMLAFDPTALEQAYLESINRTRTDPEGELSVLFSDIETLTSRDFYTQGAIDFFNVSPSLFLSQWADLTAVAPVAWNSDLHDAALGHTNRMIQFDMQEHTLPGEAGLGDRIRAEGYSLQRATENIYAFAENHLHGHAGFVVDWGEGPGGIQDPAGHRDNYFDPGVEEVGVAVLTETNPNTDVGPQLVTHNFARRGNYSPQIVGTVFTDSNQNGIYDPGEGHGSAVVTVRGEAGTFTTQTLSAGGYQLEVPDGTYEVIVAGPGIDGAYVIGNVVMDGENVRATLETSTGLRAPIARPDTVVLDEDGSRSFVVTLNDSAEDGAIVANSVQISRQPTRGTVSLDDSGRITYVPNSNVSGSDSFSYTVRDTNGARSNSATVTLTINASADPPVLTDSFVGTISLPEDGQRIINIGEMVHDPDGDLDWNTLVVVDQPDNGQATVSAAARQITYTPDPGFAGNDSLSFQVSDAAGNRLPETTINLIVTSINDRPNAGHDVFTVVDRSTASLAVMTNDNDPDGTLGSDAIQILTGPQVGTATISGQNLVFTAPAGFVGAVEIRYRVRDAEGAFSDPAEVTIYSLSSQGNPRQNPQNRFDVSGDGVVTPLDALQVINGLGQPLTVPTAGVTRGATPFLDVRGTGTIAPLDALQVINELNGANGRSANAALSASANVTDDLFADEDDEEVSDSLPFWLS